jgi:nucleotide-binding universal stress UspA family protein
MVLVSIGKEVQVTIVVGFVPTKEGRAALTRAVEEAKLCRAPSSSLSRGGRDFDGEQSAKSEEESSVWQELKADGVDRGAPLVRGKEPAEDLIAIADEANADLIVIGLRRRTLGVDPGLERPAHPARRACAVLS